jgi:hypothetical protein
MKTNAAPGEERRSKEIIKMEISNAKSITARPIGQDAALLSLRHR